MAKFDFNAHYVGPMGPHLNCLTHYSRTREHREARYNASIHPYFRKPGHSTMKKPKPATLLRAIEGTTLHAERHPKDAVAATRLANLQRRLATAA